MRGSDLNRRPLGYEGNSEREAIQDEPSQTKDDDDLVDCHSVRLWAASVRLLHRYFTVGRTVVSRWALLKPDERIFPVRAQVRRVALVSQRVDIPPAAELFLEVPDFDVNVADVIRCPGVTNLPNLSLPP